jgi:hypothetical protein
MPLYLGGVALLVAGTVLGFLYAPQAETKAEPVEAEPPSSLEVTAVPSRSKASLLQSTPAGASVFFASDLLGKTPLEVLLPEEGSERHLSIELGGFQSAHVLLQSDSPPVIVVSLEKKEVPAKEPAPAKKKKKKKRTKVEDTEEEEVPIW